MSCVLDFFIPRKKYRRNGCERAQVNATIVTASGPGTTANLRQRASRKHPHGDRSKEQSGAIRGAIRRGRGKPLASQGRAGTAGISRHPALRANTGYDQNMARKLGDCYRCEKRPQFKGYAWCDRCLLADAKSTANGWPRPEWAAHTLYHLRRNGLIARLPKKMTALLEQMAAMKRARAALFLRLSKPPIFPTRAPRFHAM